MLLVKDMVSDNKDYSVKSPVVEEKKIVVPNAAKIDFVKAKQQGKPVRKPIKYAEMYSVADETSKNMLSSYYCCVADETSKNMLSSYYCCVADETSKNMLSSYYCCLKSYKTLKKQYDDLRVEFNKSEFNLVTYERGLASVEEQLIFYKKNEVIFCEQIDVLKREEFQQPEFQSYGPKSCETESKNASKEIPNKLKESPNAHLVKDRVSDNKDCSVKSPVMEEKKTVVPNAAKIEFVKAKQQEKPIRKPIKYVEMYMSQGPRGN
nr:hypothetical protein [Tanacetum cinerariifolium]